MHPRHFLRVRFFLRPSVQSLGGTPCPNPSFPLNWFAASAISRPNDSRIIATRESRASCFAHTVRRAFLARAVAGSPLADARTHR
jgi:hypothetical protein